MFRTPLWGDRLLRQLYYVGVSSAASFCEVWNGYFVHHHSFSPSLPRRLFPLTPPPAFLLHRSVSAAPGAQVVGLYEAADDGANQAGWGGGDDGDVFHIAVVITGSLFAEETGFDSSVRCGAVACQCRGLRAQKCMQTRSN